MIFSMRLKKASLKRVLCALLACALVVMPVTPASAATARATTMKLEKTEGTVTLKTQNGSARKITNGMRLYNGNKLKTAKYSYAYVSLDSTKAVKLDQSSSATLRQNGKELELLVKSGKLFFNVSKPLTQKENMNVRTSTMVTGIRGTCGVVEYVDANKSKLYLIEGQVTLGSGENATTIYGGQTATVILQPKKESGGSDQPGESDQPGDADKPDKEVEQTVLVEKMTEKTIPPVALQEIVSDPVLQQKIEKSTELKIEKIEAAFEQFQKEEAERIEAEKEEQEKEKEEENKPEEGSQANESFGSGGSSTSGSGTVAVREITLSGEVTPGAIQAVFQGYDKVHIKGTTMRFGENDSLTIPGGKELIVWGTQLSIPATTTINVGESGTKALLCVPKGQIFSAGSINVTAGSRLEVHGTLNCASLTGGANSVLINNHRIELSGALQMESSATYYDDPNAVLISRQTSASALPDRLSLQVSTATDADVPMYVYAPGLNQRVSDYLYERSQQGNVTAAFQKDAIVSSDVTIKTNVEKKHTIAFSLGEHQLRLTSGTLTIEADVSVRSANANAAILLDGGNLKLDGTSQSLGSAVVENLGSGYAIARSTKNSGTVTWNDEMRVIRSPEAGSADKIVQGMSLNAAGIVDLSNARYCSLKPGYFPEYKENQLQLVYLPSTFSDDGDNLTVERLNAALKRFQTVTVGPNISLSMKNGESVDIPAGKILNIESVQTSNGAGGFTGSFDLEAGARISIGDGARLKVCGKISGNGTVGNTSFASDGYLMVVSSGVIEANTIQLKGCNIDNDGIIDVRTIDTVGTGTILNRSLIKTQNYTTTGTDKYKYPLTDKGVLVSDQDLNECVTTDDGAQALLAVANASGSTATQYFYASLLNPIMADRITKIKSTGGTAFSSGVSLWKFKKNAIVYHTINIDFSGVNVDMSEYMISVGDGSTEIGLTLENIGTISGTSGLGVIHMYGGSQFTVSGGGMTPKIANTASGCAILPEAGTVVINLNTDGLVLQASSFEKTIRGVEMKDDGTVVPPACVTIPDGYSYRVSDGTTLEVYK